MRTINLQTVYQLVITALLLGACLGLLGQRLPALLEGVSLSLEQPIVAAAAMQDVTTSKTNDANVQVEVEVHTRGNASAHASALGPGGAEVQASTEGDGDSRSVAYMKAPDSASWVPAVQPAAEQELATQSAAGVASRERTVAANGQPQARVVEAVVNLRTSPTLDGAVAATAARDQEFTVVGRDRTNTWWLVCCEQAQSLWIYSGVVQVTGNANLVGVVQQPNAVVSASNAQMISLPTPTRVAALSTVVPPVDYEFMLAEQTQFEEHIVPRIFFYVHQKEDGLGGYTVRIRKDGVDLPVVKATVAGLPGYTWPLPNERQRYTNLKVEFPHIAAAGLWEVQLLDEAGRAVGPIAIFRLQPGDTHQEMYVRYRKL